MYLIRSINDKIPTPGKITVLSFLNMLNTSYKEKNKARERYKYFDSQFKKSEPTVSGKKLIRYLKMRKYDKTWKEIFDLL